MDQLTNIEDNMNNFDQNSQSSQLGNMDNQTIPEETSKFEGKSHYFFGGKKSHGNK